ncbi:hypothetical protein GCM10022398_31040 [Acetobacter lovaniensis]|nr:hypothetical protein AA0474_2106 [Acetobacter lovaniensis NRIC 0474]
MIMATQAIPDKNDMKNIFTSIFPRFSLFLMISKTIKAAIKSQEIQKKMSGIFFMALKNDFGPDIGLIGEANMARPSVKAEI